MQKKGFTIIELLIALAITAILTTAVAFAFNASIVNFQENEQEYDSLNRARQALTRMTNELRTAVAVETDTSENHKCRLITAAGKDIEFRLTPGERRLTLTDKATEKSYLLCDNVKSLRFTKTLGVRDSVTYVKSVQINMTVFQNTHEKTFTSAVVIRRNLP